MNISVLGLGYVGCVTAACLARDGHNVVGVDVNPLKVDSINSGQSPVVEPGLDEIIENEVKLGHLKASLDSKAAILHSQISLVCVGTPSNDNGSLNLQYVDNVCQEIGEALKIKQGYHVIVIRSTVLPGTVQDRLIPILEEYSGLCAGIDFGVCMNPEFLREGSAIKDYYNPSLIVIGELDQRSGDFIYPIYKSINGTVSRTSLKAAEMVKYSCNAFHALKVAFANEIGNICKKHGIDGQEVMEIFVKDRQLNISDTYLRPGFAFGGSCLPKDVRALVYRAKEVDLDCNLLNSILPSNQKHIEIAIRTVEKSGKKKVGLLGLSFKPETDDLRESPAIILAETLMGRGYQVLIFDDTVQLSRIIGANKTYLEQELPHIAAMMCSSLEELMSRSEVVVISHGSRAFHKAPDLINGNQILIDLVGIAKGKVNVSSAYEGICW